MKKDFLVTKYVYKCISGDFLRSSGNGYISIFDELHELVSFKFPKVRKIEFSTNLTGIDCRAIAWIDKHGNIIVRIFHEKIKQTKIDF